VITVLSTDDDNSQIAQLTRDGCCDCIAGGKRIAGCDGKQENAMVHVSSLELEEGHAVNAWAWWLLHDKNLFGDINLGRHRSRLGSSQRRRIIGLCCIAFRRRRAQVTLAVPTSGFELEEGGCPPLRGTDADETRPRDPALAPARRAASSSLMR